RHSSSTAGGGGGGGRVGGGVAAATCAVDGGAEPADGSAPAASGSTGARAPARQRTQRRRARVRRRLDRRLAVRIERHADFLRARLQLLHPLLELADALLLGGPLAGQPARVVALLDVGPQALHLALHQLDRTVLLLDGT